ncbi:MAG: cyclic nucleotide-binding protein [Deltaproteobacteria bacterium]|nr:cyclic nucleotide-binding protein [Deltaproteobacteria bacterium]
MTSSESGPTIRVRVGESSLEVPRGTLAADVLAQAGAFGPEVVAATVDNHLYDLATPLASSATVAPVDQARATGRRVLSLSARYLFLAAAERAAPDVEVSIGPSLPSGQRFRVRDEEGVLIVGKALEDLAGKLERSIASLVDADLRFESQLLSLDAAEALLGPGHPSRERLLAAWPEATVPVLTLGSYHDLKYGVVARSTGRVGALQVTAVENGLIVRWPEETPVQLGEDDHHLLRITNIHRAWNRQVGVATIGDLNHHILYGDIEDCIRITEARHERDLANIAALIAEKRETVRIVTLAGPSSAGKTTTVRRLSLQLKVAGIEPVIIGLDDYYRDRVDCPRDESGEYDFEALEALDLALLQHHLAALQRGEEVRVPHFDFKNERPASKETWRPLVLEPQQILLIEGIHGLNPELTRELPQESCFRLYVNAVSPPDRDHQHRMHTTDLRLLRRIIRDRRYRGTMAAETIERWPSVRRGEERHIFPHAHRAHATFDSSLVFELGVLKTFAWRYLLEVPRSHPSRVRAHGLLELLTPIVPILPDAVPSTSLLREFIGGSTFRY